jgi:hypothetical protein
MLLKSIAGIAVYSLYHHFNIVLFRYMNIEHFA